MTSRRNVLSAAAGGLAALTLPAAAATEPDPIYALIEAHKQAWAEFEEALRALSRAQDALSKDTRAHAFIHIGEDTVIMRTEREVDEAISPKGLPRLNATLKAQLKAAVERETEIMAPYKQAEQETSDTVSDVEAELFSTPPTTLAGLTALLTYMKQHSEREKYTDLAQNP